MTLPSTFASPQETSLAKARSDETDRSYGSKEGKFFDALVEKERDARAASL